MRGKTTSKIKEVAVYVRNKTKHIIMAQWNIFTSNVSVARSYKFPVTNLLAIFITRQTSTRSETV
jgi:hypothetical protein